MKITVMNTIAFLVGGLFPLYLSAAPQLVCPDVDCFAMGLICRSEIKDECMNCPNEDLEICPESCVIDSSRFYCAYPGNRQCTSQDDCSDDRQCSVLTFSDCTENNFVAMICDEKGENCQEPEMKSECTPKKVTSCVPRFATRCDADSDCGRGFGCNSAQFCTLNILSCVSDADCDSRSTCLNESEWERGKTPCKSGRLCESASEGDYCVPVAYAAWAKAGGVVEEYGKEILSIENLAEKGGGCVTSKTSPKGVFLFLMAFFFAIKRRRSKKVS